MFLLKKKITFLIFITLCSTNTILAQTVNVVDNKGTVNTADADPENEIQDLTLNTITNTLKVTNNTSATAIDLSRYYNINNWFLDGNAGTDPSINFLGTIDNVPLLIRTNGERRVTIGDINTSNPTQYHRNISNRFSPSTSISYSGDIIGVNQFMNLNNISANNFLGIENLMYIRSGSNISNTMRGLRNVMQNIQGANLNNVLGVSNEYRGEVSDLTNYKAYRNFFELRTASNITNVSILSSEFSTSNSNTNGVITNFYGVNLNSPPRLDRVTNYYGFFQGNLGTLANKFAFLYDGNDTTTTDVAITGLGRVGIGTQTPNTLLEISGNANESGLRFTNLINTTPTTTTDVQAIGVNNNGDVVTINAFSTNVVENELYFEDTDFHYVSLQVNTTDYIVTRYSKTDINLEEEATGTGTQPNTLSDVQALTYL